VVALVAVIQFGPRKNAAAENPAASPAAASAPPQSIPPTTPPVEAEPPPEKKSVAAVPAPVTVQPQKATRSVSSAASSAPLAAPPPAQQAPQQQVQQQQVQQQSAVQTPPRQSAPPQTTPAPEIAAQRAEWMAIRETFAKLSARASSVRNTLQNLQRSQAASGLGMSSNLLTPWNLMESFLKGASDAINASDITAAQDLMNKADRQIDRLETALNK
jgi:hypothetical protein